MNQQRLNILPRTLSEGEQNHNSNLRSKALSIRQAYKDMEKAKKELERRRERQETNGLMVAEVAITDATIEKKMKEHKQQIKAMELEYQKMKSDSTNIQRKSTQQKQITF